MVRRADGRGRSRPEVGRRKVSGWAPATAARGAMDKRLTGDDPCREKGRKEKARPEGLWGGEAASVVERGVDKTDGGRWKLRDLGRSGAPGGPGANRAAAAPRRRCARALPASEAEGGELGGGRWVCWRLPPVCPQLLALLCAICPPLVSPPGAAVACDVPKIAPTPTLLLPRPHPPPPVASCTTICSSAATVGA